MVASGRSHKGFVALAGRSDHLRSPASTAPSAPPPLFLGLHLGRRGPQGSQGLRGSFNDVVLAATAGAFRQLLLSRGESVERPVRSLVPVSVRTRDTSGRAIGDGTLANKVSGMFADLPVGIEDPVERLALSRPK